MRHRELVLAKNILCFVLAKNIEINPKRMACKQKEFIYSPAELYHCSVIMGKKNSLRPSSVSLQNVNDFTVIENSIFIVSFPYYRNMVDLSMHIMIPFTVIYMSISYFVGLAEHLF